MSSQKDVKSQNSPKSLTKKKEEEEEEIKIEAFKEERPDTEPASEQEIRSISQRTVPEEMMVESLPKEPYPFSSKSP